MSMVTKCPTCATTFRVTPQQLQAQHGMVRCGRCANVFDGFKALATLRDDTPLEAESEPTPRDELRAGDATTTAQVDAGPAPALPTPLPAQHREAVASVKPVDAARFEVELPVTGAPFAAPPLPQKRGGGWAFGVIVLLITLAAQGVYFYRSEIAASVPEARPHLNRMCELLLCAVALPQRPRQISIEASDMQATDPANSGLIALTATLRNQATVEVGYPALDVVLTNTKEHTVARRIFVPAEYLDAGSSARAGIAPNAEVTVRLNLDTGELGAAGFRLDLLAAPAR